MIILVRNRDLSYNALTALAVGLLNTLTSLTDLYLNNNNIAYIPPNSFIDIGASILIVDLHANSLTSITPYTFNVLGQLDYFDLSQNLITSQSSFGFIGTSGMGAITSGLNTSVYCGATPATTLCTGKIIVLNDNFLMHTIF